MGIMVTRAARFIPPGNEVCPMNGKQPVHVGAYLAELSAIMPDTLLAWHHARERVRELRRKRRSYKRCHRAWKELNGHHERLVAAIRTASGAVSN